MTTRTILGLGIAFLLVGCSVSRSQFAWQLSGELNRMGEGELSVLQAQGPAAVPHTLSAGGQITLFDVYKPIQGAGRATILAIPGAAELGKDDPRIVAFARVLARAGFIVCIPDLVGLRSLRVGPKDVRDIADSFFLLSESQELAPQGRVGMVAFSYAAGPALLAALEPYIREKVRFLVLVGGYHDLQRLVRFSTTGFHEYRGRRETLAPHEYGQFVFLPGIADLIDPADHRILTEMINLRIADPSADLDPLAKHLTPDGRNLYAIMANRDPEQAPSLIANLDPRVRQWLRALSPSTHDLSRLRARVYLIHGRWDPAIPYTESLYLRDALREIVPVRLAILETLHHVELGAPSRHPLSSPLDRWRLWWILYHLAREQE